MKLVNVRWVDGACHATLAVALRRAIEVDRVGVGDVHSEILGCVEARVEAIGGGAAGGCEIALDHIVCCGKTEPDPIQWSNRGIELVGCSIGIILSGTRKPRRILPGEK